MNKPLKNKKTLGLLALFLSAITLSSCTDSDYDFDNIDATIGFGSESLALPVSSTDAIKLADILKIEAEDCIDTLANGDYVFSQKGDNVSGASPRIASFELANVGTAQQSYTINLSRPTTATRARRAAYNLSKSVYSINFSGNLPAEVTALDSVPVDSKVTLRLNIPAEMASSGAKFSQVTFTLPTYLHVKSVSAASAHAINGSVVTLSNVTSSQTVDIAFDMVKMKTASGTAISNITQGNGKVNFDGSINIDLTVDGTDAQLAAIAGKSLGVTSSMSTMQVLGAYGKFNPTIDLDNIGTTKIKNIPDFLTDDDVVVDLYNPQIILTLDNDMDVAGRATGTVVSHKDGAAIATVEVPEFKINKKGSTKICICRNAADVDATAYDQVVTVSDLSKLIRTIPDEISFSATASADNTQSGYFAFNHSYSVKPAYEVFAPLTFAEDADIVYVDTLDGWNDDIDKMALSDDAYITVKAQVENRMPAALKVNVVPVDLRMNDISADISVDVSNEIKGSADVNSPVLTPLTIVIKQKKGDAFKRLDGLLFKVEGKAKGDDGTTIVGQTLNAHKHTLVARDINVTLTGKFVIDGN